METKENEYKQVFWAHQIIFTIKKELDGAMIEKKIKELGESVTIIKNYKDRYETEEETQ